MLISFLLTDKEAVGYFKRKFQQCKEKNGFNFPKLNYKVGPIVGPEVVGPSDDIVVPVDNVAASDEVISIENED